MCSLEKVSYLTKYDQYVVMKFRIIQNSHILASFLKSYHFILEWIKIEGSNVINLDIPATNGVVQVLESVIQVVFRILN